MASRRSGGQALRIAINSTAKPRCAAPPALLFKRKRSAFGRYSNRCETHIPYTLCLRAVATGSTPSLGLFLRGIPGVNLRSTCTYSHYLYLSMRVPRIRQPYADTDTAIRHITQHYFARSNHRVPFFHHVSIHRYPARVLRVRIPRAQPWKVSNLERIGKDWTYCYALRFRATHRIVMSIVQRSLKNRSYTSRTAAGWPIIFTGLALCTNYMVSCIFILLGMS